MKTIILKSKNFFAKIALTTLGFALSTTQCLAQYMAIIPGRQTVQGKLTGISDTLRNFKIIINRDTLYTSWKEGYKFNYKLYYPRGSAEVLLNIEVPEDEKYQRVNKIIAIKPYEYEDQSEVEIVIKEKEKE